MAAIGQRRIAVEVKTGLADSIGDPGYRFDTGKQHRVRRLGSAIGAHRVDFIAVEVANSGVKVHWLPAVD